MNLSEAKELAQNEMSKWLDNTWSFSFNRRKKSFGCCRYDIKEIQLSGFLTPSQPDEEVLDTIRHEIAHALAGPKANHGTKWKQWAKKVGATPLRVSKKIKLSREEMNAKWVIVCPQGKIRKTYLRKPNAKTFREIHRWFIIGERESTEGKLKLIPYAQYKEINK